jgi:uncharacterized heparinase superfamily protein
LELAASACAGCLSFEMSTGLEPLFVNVAAARMAGPDARAVARATASHNTLCLGEQSSGRLIRNARLERAIGDAPVAHPSGVDSELQEADNGDVELRAAHDGYVEAFGLLHERSLKLHACGTRLEGRDRIFSARAVMRFPWDIPVAVHFHLHPHVEATLGPSPESVELLLRSGERWRLAVTGAAVLIEEGESSVDPSGRQRGMQLVMRARCSGSTEICWTVERIEAGRRAGARERRSHIAKGLAERLAETEAGFEIS